MRCIAIRAIPDVLLLVAMLCAAAAAQSAALVRIVASHVVIQRSAQTDYVLNCPAGYIPVAYSWLDQYASSNQELSRNLIDRGRTVLDRRSLAGAAELDGGGFAQSLLNISSVNHDVEGIVVCLSPAASIDGTLVLVSNETMIDAQANAAVTSFCNADHPVAIGGISSADAVKQQEIASAPVWGTSAEPVLLGSLSDGAMASPTGWRFNVINTQMTAAVVKVYAICANAPGLQTFIYTGPTIRGVLGNPNPFSVVGALPEGWTAVGAGFNGGLYGTFAAFDAWVNDGGIVGMMPWFEGAGDYDSGDAAVRAFVAHGTDTRRGITSSAPGRAVLAVLALPVAVSPASVLTTVVEYHHASLDHYFITAFADEIAKLDSGALKGWTRTGQTFNAYVNASGGPATRRPVCRLYGRPDAGIDSHFYSASPGECRATLVNNKSVWMLETNSALEIDLPDAATGACANGAIPVYRVWNKRYDSNHRYMTSTAIRDEMLQRGAVPEGYGPYGVAFCAPQ